MRSFAVGRDDAKRLVSGAILPIINNDTYHYPASFGAADLGPIDPRGAFVFDVIGPLRYDAHWLGGEAMGLDLVGSVTTQEHDFLVLVKPLFHDRTPYGVMTPLPSSASESAVASVMLIGRTISSVLVVYTEA